MIGWWAHRQRARRARAYLLKHPEDEPAVRAILTTLQLAGPFEPRDVADLVAGKQVSDEDWEKFGPRWERAYYFIVR